MRLHLLWKRKALNELLAILDPDPHALKLQTPKSDAPNPKAPTVEAKQLETP